MGSTTRGLLKLVAFIGVLLLTLNSVQLIRFWKFEPFPMGVTVAAIVGNTLFGVAIVIKILYDCSTFWCCDGGASYGSV